MSLRRGMMAGVSGGDPSWSNVVSLLHFDNNLTDEKGKVWGTGAANPVSTQSKFGGYSLRATSTAYRQSSASNDWAFGTGDFTVEMFIFIIALPSNFASPWGNLTTTVGCCFWVRPDTPGQLMWRARDGSSVAIGSPGGAISAGVWHHIAYTRASGTGRLFIDGVQVGTGADASTYSTTASPSIGRNGLSADYFDGYIDEVRVTKGVARYTSAFTPPTAPFPNS